MSFAAFAVTKILATFRENWGLKNMLLNCSLDVFPGISC